MIDIDNWLEEAYEDRTYIEDEYDPEFDDDDEDY
jgi:hypothetical protein